MEDHAVTFIAQRIIRAKEFTESGEFSINFIDPLENVQEVRHEVYDLINSDRRPRRQGNPAAEWRLRCKRAANIESELTKLGKLALLTGSSMLTCLINGSISSPKRSSNAKETLRNSPLYLQLSVEGKRRLAGAQYENYSSVENSIQEFGAMICLAVSNLNDTELIESFNKFKVRIVEHAFSSPTSVDEVTETIKSLGKLCQALFLRSELPEIPLADLLMENGRLIPFEGELAFINDLYSQGIRKQPLTYHQARILAQIGNTPRGLSYPSSNQIKASIAETIEIVTTHESSNPIMLKAYEKGLAAVRSSIGPKRSNKTHVSLVTSGTTEASRSQGGRAKVLVLAARRTTDLLIEEDCQLVDKFDQFGEKIISGTVWRQFLYNMRTHIYLRNPTLGDLMYLKPEDVTESLNKSLNQGLTVPKELAKILNLTAAKLIRSNGYYDPPCVEIYNTIYFDQKRTKFKLVTPLQVKADVSIESGLKSRLITAPQAAFAHLSQLPANLLREYYSQDPFCRVGFEESDKLWEVLKAFKNLTDG
jgi:hypothetical protein